jgi:hypothetical protein
LQQKSESTSVFGHIPTTTLAGGQVVPVLANGAEFLQMAGIYSAGYAAVFAIFSLMYGTPGVGALVWSSRSWSA